MAEQVPHDDLFEGPAMSFGEHLEELRTCLFKAVIGIAIGVLFGLWIANSVVRFFQSPLESAMKNYYLQTAMQDLGKEEFPDGVPPEVATMILDRHLLPEKVPIDVGQFISAVRSQFPDALPAGSMSSYVYSANDFETRPQIYELCRKLAAGKSAEKSPAGWIWKSLTEADQTELARLAAKDSFNSSEEHQFFAVLNRVIENPELYQATEFSGQELPPLPQAVENARASELATSEEPVTEDSLQGEPPLGPGTSLDKTRQRNKRALAAAFSGQLRRPGVTTVSLWQWKPVRVKFQVLSAEESFMIWMKAGVVTGIALASPWIFLQIWTFVAAGLYRHEKNYVYIYLPFSMGLFLAGASLAFFFVFQPVLDFLFSFQSGMNADFEPRIGEWMSFVLIMPLGFGISFQLPLVMLFLNRIGLVDISLYTANWRIAILIIFIVAMILTPADPVSMMLMAVPLCFLYVAGILMCKWMPRGRSPFEAAYEP